MLKCININDILIMNDFGFILIHIRKDDKFGRNQKFRCGCSA